MIVMVAVLGKTVSPQQAASPGFDLSDPIGVCKISFGGFHVCNNMAYGGSVVIKGIGVASIIFAVFIGDALDFFGWIIEWIPFIGDFVGSPVLGNILDAIAFVILLYWIGFPAFFGLGEFVDILGFIPVFGDILGFIDVLPWWTWAVAIWLIFQLLKTFNLTNFRLPFLSSKKERNDDMFRGDTLL